MITQTEKICNSKNRKGSGDLKKSDILALAIASVVTIIFLFISGIMLYGMTLVLGGFFV